MLRENSTSSAQQLLITLLGDYRHIAPKWIATAALIQIMREFEIGPESVRTALSRLTKQDLIQRRKFGRETAYSLTSHGQELLLEGETRLREFASDRPWDRNWTAIAFTIQEAQRSKRHQLRSQLRAVGFGPLYDGFWISPHATSEQAKLAIRAAEVENAIVLRGQIETIDASFETVSSVWNTQELRHAYDAFIVKYQPLRDRLDGGKVSPIEALLARTRMMDEWRLFPRIDPEIPAELLPDDWPRTKAGRLFHQCYQMSAPLAEFHFTAMVGKD